MVHWPSSSIDWFFINREHPDPYFLRFSMTIPHMVLYYTITYGIIPIRHMINTHILLIYVSFGDNCFQSYGPTLT